jgi:hypothetical protein
LQLLREITLSRAMSRDQSKRSNILVPHGRQLRGVTRQRAHEYHNCAAKQIDF